MTRVRKNMKEKTMTYFEKFFLNHPGPVYPIVFLDATHFKVRV